MFRDFLKRTFAAPAVNSREDLGKVLVADASRYVEDPRKMESLLRAVIGIDPHKLAASDNANQNAIEVIEQARGRPNTFWSKYTKHFRACIMNPSTPTQAVMATRQAIKAYLLQNDENYRALYLNQSPRPEVAAARALASEFNSSISSLETSMRTASNFRGSDRDEMESESAQLISSALAVPRNIAARYSELCNALATVPEDQRRGVNLSRGILPSNFSYLDSQSGGNNEADVESLVGGVRRAVAELRGCKARLVENVLRPLGIASAEAGSELREMEARQLDRMFKQLGYNDQQVMAAMGYLGFKWGEILESDRREAAARSAQEERELRQQQMERDRDAEQRRRATEAERIAREAQQERERQEQARQEQARQDQARQAEERLWRQNMAEGIGQIVEFLSALREAAERQQRQQSANRGGFRDGNVVDVDYTITPGPGSSNGGRDVVVPSPGVRQIGGGAPSPFDPPAQSARAGQLRFLKPGLQLQYTPEVNKAEAEARITELRESSAKLASAVLAEGATKETVRPFAAMLDQAVTGLVNVLSRNPENRGMLEPLIRLGTSVTQIDNVAFGADFALNLGKKLTDWLGSLVTRANPVLPPGVKKLSMTTDPRPEGPTDQPQL